jgi:hypothetical protein
MNLSGSTRIENQTNNDMHVDCGSIFANAKTRGRRPLTSVKGKADAVTAGLPKLPHAKPLVQPG